MTDKINIEKIKRLTNKLEKGLISFEEYQIKIKKQLNKSDKKRTITDINKDMSDRQTQINDWHKNNKGQTELSRINKDKNLVQEKIEKLLNDGATKIENPDYKKMSSLYDKIGKRLFISYITKDGQYRSGGFLTGISEYYFVVLGGQINNKISFSVQYSNVKELYAKQIQSHQSTTPIKPIKTKKPKTKFPVKINNIVVYYAKDNYDRRRFKQTNKYKRMIKYIEKKKKKNVK